MVIEKENFQQLVKYKEGLDETLKKMMKTELEKQQRVIRELVVLQN